MNYIKKFSSPIVWKILFTVSMAGFLLTFFGLNICGDDLFSRPFYNAVNSSVMLPVLSGVIIIILVVIACLAGILFTWLNRPKISLAATTVFLRITIYGVAVVTNAGLSFNPVSSFFTLSVAGLIVFNLLAVKYTKTADIQQA